MAYLSIYKDFISFNLINPEHPIPLFSLHCVPFMQTTKDQEEDKRHGGTEGESVMTLNDNGEFRVAVRCS